MCGCPGLESFNEQKKNLFFGRQRLVDALLDKLKTNSLLAVIGSSGTGKSSVVLAGLLPYLKTGALPESENWHYYDRILPGSNPLKSLAQIICPSDANPNDWIPEAVAQFLQDSSYLTQVINRYSNSIPSVLVVDQFEEVFTLCQDKSVRKAFIDNLLGLVKSLALSYKVILTMRADFESQVVTLGDDFQTSYELAKVQVTYLGASELREAIEKPAELIGLKFEKGLITALVNDVLGEPSALPLLQFTLLKLWDSRERNRITWDAYKRLSGGREVGGAREALQRIAEEFYNRFINEDRDAVKRILLRMVRPREGSDFTSNRVTVPSLYRSGEDDTLTKRVLNKLIDADLVRLTKGASTAPDQVEVSHEALVRNWQRLADWLDQDRKAIRERLHLTEAVEQWLAKNKEVALLWRGNQLAEALKYDDLNIIETEFVSCSQEVEQTEIAEQQKQVEEKIRLDEKIKQKSKEFSIAVIFSIVILCLSALALYSAWDSKKSRSEAVASYNDAKKSEFLNIINSSQVFYSTHNPLQALVEAIRATKKWKEFTPEIQKDQEKTAIEQLQKIVKEAHEFGEYNLLVKHTKRVRSVSFSSSGEYIASGGYDGRIVIWNLTGKIEKEILLPKKEINSLSFGDNNQTVALGCTDGSVILWRWKTKELPKEILANKKDQGQILSVTYSPKGQFIASSSEYEYLNLWKSEEIKTKIEPYSSYQYGSKDKYNTKVLYSVAFSADEQTLALGFGNHQIWLTKVNSLDSQTPLKAQHTNKVHSVNFSLDGRFLASGGDDGVILLFNTKDYSSIIKAFIGHGSGVRSVSFSKDGKFIASGSDDGSVKLWETSPSHSEKEDRDPLPLHTFNGYGGVVYSVSYSPDGKYIVSGHGDGIVRIWKTDLPTSIQMSSNLDDLVEQGCYWVKDYLKTNPNVDEKDRQLCGD